MEFRIISRATLILAALLSTTGCYIYTPVQMEELTPDIKVRAFVSADRAREIEGITGRDAREIEGSVVESGADELMLLVPVISRIERRGGTLSQRLSIPNSDVMGIELRELDTTRTGAIIGVAGGIGLYFLIKQLRSDGRQQGPGPGPGPVEDQGFRIMIPFRIGG